MHIKHFPSIEHLRLDEDRRGTNAWRRWGAYLSERQWGTVREDYSADGSAWDHFPHDHARSRAYRWGEDGIAGFSDDQQLLCLSLALWNGKDPILKERLFGLTGPEAGVPVRTAGRREPPPREERDGIRAARHRRVRR